MALKIKKVEHLGKSARDKNQKVYKSGRNLPEYRVKVNGEIRPVIEFSSFTLFVDETVKGITFNTRSSIAEELFSNFYIDSNRNIISVSKEVSLFSKEKSNFISAYVEIEPSKYKLMREIGVTSLVPLFSRIDISENQFKAMLNPLFGLVVYEDKLVLLRRDDRFSKYSIRLENMLRKYKTGRIEIKYHDLLKELNASLNYEKDFSQFNCRVLKAAVEMINFNNAGVYIRDFGRIYENNSSTKMIIWFDVEIEK